MQVRHQCCIISTSASSQFSLIQVSDKPFLHVVHAPTHLLREEYHYEEYKPERNRYSCRERKHMAQIPRHQSECNYQPHNAQCHKRHCRSASRFLFKCLPLASLCGRYRQCKQEWCHHRKCNTGRHYISPCLAHQVVHKWKQIVV